MKDYDPHINPNPACNVAAVGGTLSLSGAFTGCRRGNLLLRGEQSPRLSFTGGRFLFGHCSDVVPLTAATCKPLRRAVSSKAVSNLHGAAYPVERVSGSRYKLRGLRIMGTLSKAQCIRAQRVQITLNHLRATACAVRSAVNPYASLDIHRDAQANRRFSSFAAPLRLPEKFPKLTEEAGADALEAVRRIRQVIALDGDDSRTHWLDPVVNVDRISAIARGFLWPNAFTPVDEKESKKPLSGLSRRMLEAVKHSRNKDDRALLGFPADKLREAGFFLFALSLALPNPRSQTGEG